MRGEIQFGRTNGIFIERKEGDLTQSYDKKNPYTNRKFENQWDHKCNISYIV